MNHEATVNPFALEGDILQAKHDSDQFHLSLENALINSRNLLQSQIGENGDNMFALLMRLVSRILSEKSEHAVNLFEEYCRLVKQGHYIHPDYKLRDVTGAERDRQVTFSKNLIRQVRSLEECPDLSAAPTGEATIAQLSLLWSQIGFALPPTMDYFIDRQLERMRCREQVKRVRFWGVIHNLSSDYYIIELERDDLEALRLEREMSREKVVLAGDIITGLLRFCISDDSIVSDWCGAESMVADMLDFILEDSIPPNTDEDLARAVAVPTMDVLIREAVDVAQEPEVELSVMGSLDVVSCSATMADRSELSLDGVKFAAAKMVLEVKLNALRYFVCRDPIGEDWVELPGVNLDKIKASCNVRSYFKGDLATPIRGSVGRKFLEREQDYLRAVLARITMDQVSRRSESLLFSKRDVSVYYKETGFPSDWSVRELNGRQPLPRIDWYRSNIWPGSFAFDLDQIYHGWGLEENAVFCRKGY
ncbi:uncharacterized protein LOC131676480 [Topomyia yanbarensis]|uniref:uncharacterized protein LOC131676480 n=1 Tax=Topomyia yanbarensis TaxID=2498891 RepID=UPI00273C6347|nr:uncharacterized protein LOC131676480 [Topomyia yanbarensis]